MLLYYHCQFVGFRIILKYTVMLILYIFLPGIVHFGNNNNLGIWGITHYIANYKLLDYYECVYLNIKKVATAVFISQYSTDLLYVYVNLATICSTHTQLHTSDIHIASYLLACNWFIAMLCT